MTGVQPALPGYKARRAREDHELDLLRGRAAGVAGSGGGVDGMDTGAADGTIKSTISVKRAVVLRGRVGNQGIPRPRRPRLVNHDSSGAGVVQASGSRGAIEHRPFSSQVRWFYLAPGSPKTSCSLDGQSTR